MTPDYSIFETHVLEELLADDDKGSIILSYRSAIEAELRNRENARTLMGLTLAPSFAVDDPEDDLTPAGVWDDPEDDLDADYEPADTLDDYDCEGRQCGMCLSCTNGSSYL